ncbi:MAG TPA: threonine synthase [Anaerolineales bacterium]|nr:threonine synthase [Anaerolineales bacterium]
MPVFLGYHCHRCGKDYPPQDVFYTCPDDGANLEVRLDLERIRATSSPQAISSSSEPSIWRYLALLPVRAPGHRGTPLWAVGWTPLLAPDRLAGRLGLRHLWLKDDGRNPTASFKDRASAVVVARAQEIAAGTVVTASTGNAGAALAGMAAAAGQPAVILAPRSAPPAKVAQLLIFGARVLLVEGSYDQAFDLTVEASAALGWYCRNTGYNPFTAEGKKTAAFEICEQLTAAEALRPNRPPSPAERGWTVPDVVFVSVGDGNIISGLHKGFRDLHDLGWIERLPRLIGVQAEGSAAVYRAFAAGADEITPVHAETIADSISVDLPRDGVRALLAVRQTGGSLLTVADEAILRAIRELGVEAGVFAEPAAATAYAGLVEAVRLKRVDPGERVVVVLTGSGLKDVRAARQAAGEATVIEPTLPALRRALAQGTPA